jgi:hypothetical protein
MSGTPETADNVVRLIVGGLEGKLTTPAGEEVPVRVFERGQEMLAVLLSVPDEQLGREPMRLEYSSPHGLVRFRGRATIERQDLLRFPLGELPEVVQRREFVRVGAVQPVVLVSDEDGSALDGHAIEVSGGGMLLTGPNAVGVGSVVRFTLHLGDGEGPITGRGRIVRVEAGGRCAMMFDEISQADRQRLIHFIFQRQRAALAKGVRVAPPKRQPAGSATGGRVAPPTRQPGGSATGGRVAPLKRQPAGRVAPPKRQPAGSANGGRVASTEAPASSNGGLT